MRALQQTNRTEPRWPAGITVVAIGGLFTALPSSLAVPGPRWFFPAMVRVLLAPTIISHHTDHRFLNQILGYILNGRQ